MIYLLLSICASTSLFVLFKVFERRNINTLQAIVVNYITACLFGLFSYDSTISIPKIINANWFIGALILGFLFIIVFNLMAITAQRNGLSVASVAGKMSVVIPVIFGIYAYQESLGFQKLIGVLFALAAVYLTAIKPKTTLDIRNGLLFPFLLFVGSGIIDTMIKFVETTYVPKNGIPIFSASIFGCAAVIGVFILIYKAIKNQLKFNPLSIIGGIVLGIANYYSIYFLLKALQIDHIESSTIFTINNVAIVMLSTVLGLLFFKEQIFKKNYFGIALAIVSIAIIMLAQ